ncbi:uncharacterized protein EV154DRAFT_447829 [Mucor mucedo]|uniref:uncharacterized protein n=1 Tax=Mucor mucedo TaxID=29922 RepID=UPI0022206E41|nr:uncharacterized protein EV154DRAFT_447829 [Mucor mucedo]KAI7888486.1 hypothetical protein EV154DRAFT_447829 [Mucor mucedo]
MNTTATDAITNRISLLSLDHNYGHKRHDYYIDNTSEVTVTTTKEGKSTLPARLNNDWLDEIEHSFDSSYKHRSIIESYLEPTCISHTSSTTTIPVVTTRSKYSAIKSRMKRVFRISTVDKQQTLSLPVFPANEKWTPSIDSLCSSTTTAATSNYSTKSSNRHSCGLSTASFTNKRSSKPTDVKSCLKKRQPVNNPRPTSAIDFKKNNRWSSRLSMVSPNKKRFSQMILKKKKSSTDLFTTVETNKGIRFNKFLNVHETWSREEYDRSSDPEAVCTKLTAALAQDIKEELNDFKLHEMAVHDSSRINTHFFL